MWGSNIRQPKKLHPTFVTICMKALGTAVLLAQTERLLSVQAVFVLLPRVKDCLINCYEGELALQKTPGVEGAHFTCQTAESKERPDMYISTVSTACRTLLKMKTCFN